MKEYMNTLMTNSAWVKKGGEEGKGRRVNPDTVPGACQSPPLWSLSPRLPPSVSVSLLFCLSLYLRSLSLLSLPSALYPFFFPISLFHWISPSPLLFPFFCLSSFLQLPLILFMSLCLFYIKSTLQPLLAKKSPYSCTHVPNEEAFPGHYRMEPASSHSSLHTHPPQQFGFNQTALPRLGSKK